MSKRNETQLQRIGKIKGRIIDEQHGLQILEHVYAVRIISKDYVLLVMEDYAPTLGQVEGNIVFLCKDKEVTFDNIHGYYKHEHNEFTLLIQEDEDGWYLKV